MKPLLVLLIAFCIALATTYFVSNKFNFALSGRIALSAMLIFTAIAHFAFTKGMTMMIPSFVPFKNFIVYLTGIIELCAAAGLQIPSLFNLTGWMLIAFFVLLLPANINAAVNHIDYQKGNDQGAGSNYLWFRIPLQLLFIFWTYFFAIRLHN